MMRVWPVFRFCMETLAAETVAPVESVIVPERSPVRSASAGATTNNQLNKTAVNTRTADLYIAIVPPKKENAQQTTLGLLHPGQSWSRPACKLIALGVAAAKAEVRFC